MRTRFGEEIGYRVYVSGSLDEVGAGGWDTGGTKERGIRKEFFPVLHSYSFNSATLPQSSKPRPTFHKPSINVDVGT